LRSRYGPTVLVEQFVRGREFNVPVVLRHKKLISLPFTEILFQPPAECPDLWPIVSYDAKWYPGTRDFAATPAVNPAENVSPELHSEIERLCLTAFRLTGSRDYGRVDLRLDEAGKPVILEVNPNPCISPLAGLAAGLESARIPYGEFILELVRAALARGPASKTVETIHGPSPEGNELSTEIRRDRPRIRPARRSDLEDVERLLAAADCWTADQRDQAAVKIARSLTRRNRDGWQCLVLGTRTAVLGFACLMPDPQSEGAFCLDVLVVDPGHRLNGHGRELLRAVESAVLTAGGRLVLAQLSSAPAQGSARQFLARHGYRASGEITDYYRTGCARLTYARRIAAPATDPVSESTCESVSSST
jgi:GNAT superfamily N-acetyltransferase